MVETLRNNRVAVQDVGDGSPVVLLAGFGLDHTVWDAQVTMLSDSHRTLCIDLRGTGQSDKPRRGYALSELTADIIGVAGALGAESFDLVVWSFGGQVAFNLAARHAERVRRLVLVGSIGVRACRSEEFPFGHRRDWLEPLLVRGEADNRPVSRRAGISAGFATQPDPALLDYVVRCKWMIVGSEDSVHPCRGARWLTDISPTGNSSRCPAGAALNEGPRRIRCGDPARSRAEGRVM